MITKEFRKTSGNVYAIVITDTHKKILTDTWLGEFETQENFKEVLLYISQQITQYQIRGWLADLREMKGSFNESSDWLSAFLMPLIIQSGLEKEAIVVPKDVFARLSTKDTIMKISNFELRQYDNLALAQDWLFSVNS